MTSFLGGGRRGVGVLGCVAVVLITALGLSTAGAVAADESAPPSTLAAEPASDGADTPSPDPTLPAPTTSSPTDTTASTPAAPAPTSSPTTLPDSTPPTSAGPDPTTSSATTAPDTSTPTTAPDTATPTTAPNTATTVPTPAPETIEPAATEPSAPDPTPTVAPTSTPPLAAERGGAEAGVVALAAIAAPVVTDVVATQGARDSGVTIDRTVTISWSGDPGADFDIERRASTSSTWEFVDSTYGGTSTTDRFDPGGAFGWYQYRVTPRSFDPDTGEYVVGAPGAVSVLVTRPVQPPSVPRSARATRTSSAMQVSWTAPTTVNFACQSTYFYCSPASSYVVSWAPVGGAWQSVTTTATSRTISGLAAQTTYYVSVRAVNAAGGSGATPSIRVAALARPGVVAIRAVPAPRQVALTWTAPATNGSPITKYLIQRRLVGSSTWVYVSTGTPATARSYTVTRLASSAQYEFRILAVNGVGWGAWSPPIRARTPSHQFAVNVILVGSERFTAAELRELNTALGDARGIFAKVGIYLRVRTTYGLTATQAGAHLAIDNDAEAIALTSRWTFSGNALDLFIVRSYAGWTAGLSALGGSCNKNDDAWGAMTGAVVEVQQRSTGVILAHEAGHYLGLPHLADASNFMNSVAYETATGIRPTQGTVMKGHCLMSPG